MMQSMTKYAKYSWAVLAYNVFVVLFGAFVRATGSGAGCGAHWPLCNGVILPRPERIETIIEFTHRLTSGLTLILVIGLLIWTFRTYAKGSALRISSSLVVFFTLTEALVGAGLVLFQLVEDNDSMVRAVSMVVHLVNTFLLLAMIVVNAWWATFGVPKTMKFHGVTGILLIAGGIAILMIGASGAVTALGDTLFPSTSLVSGLQDDFSSTAHYLIRLRVYHPGIAVAVGLLIGFITMWVKKKMSAAPLERLTNALFGFYGLQILLGIFNVALLAPVWIQIVHLLVSNLIWLTYILMMIVVFGEALPVRAANRTPGLSDHEFHRGIHDAKEVR